MSWSNKASIRSNNKIEGESGMRSLTYFLSSTASATTYFKFSAQTMSGCAKRLASLMLTAALSGCATVDLQATRNSAACAKTALVPNVINVGVSLTPNLIAKGDPGPVKAEYFKAGSDLIGSSRTKTLMSLGRFGTEGDVQEVAKSVSGDNPTDVQAAQDARDQIREALKGIPATAGAFLASPEQVQATLGSVDRAQATRMSKIGRTLGRGGYGALAVASFGQFQNASTDQRPYLIQEFNTAIFLTKYFEAYFRDGHFIQVSVNSSALLKKATQDVQNRLSGIGLSGDQQTTVTNALGDLEKQLQAGLCNSSDTTSTCLLTQPLGSTAFVTRAGTSVQFSGISISIGDNGKLSPTATHLSSTVIAPQLAEVFWEAVFDSFPPYVPASSTSTACVAELYPSSSSLCMDANYPKADKDKVDTVDADATKAQSAAAAAASYIIRGGWLLSLNNEAVAQAVETSVGEIARKTTEKLVWNELNQCTARVGAIVTTSNDY